MQPKSGDYIGRYRVLGKLGSGGMGTVYRAHDPRLAREVAIKVISRIGEKGEKSLQRFETEARASSALNHPHIVTVHDIDEEEGEPYFVMELVRGADLAQASSRHQEQSEIVRLAIQIADGLAAAHGQGITHRDLKPENVVVDERGSVRILDFGIAHIRDRVSVYDTLNEALTFVEEDQENTSADLATRGNAQVMGTPGYLAPELLEGAMADQRSDVFSFGALLHFLASGKGPFARSSVQASLVATVIDEPEDLRAQRPDLLASFADLVADCLEKDPRKRESSFTAIQERLKGIARECELLAPTNPAAELPKPSGPIFGRDEDLTSLVSLILSGRRLITLTGTGGSGKTRLALELVHHDEVRDRMKGQRYFVPLAGVTEPSQVAGAIVAVLGDDSTEGAGPLEAMARSINALRAPVLLCLDNFEHVIEAADLVAELLQACGDLVVVTTSRERLRLAAEQVYPVPPLKVPERLDTFGAIIGAPSVEVFVAKARQAEPNFALTPTNATDVAKICQRLDGLPLALELAAARVRMFPPHVFVERLRNDFGLLRGGSRDLHERQQTLQATINWSFELLDASEQTVFCRLSPFVGGFTMEAAEAVADPFGKLDRPLPDLLESLLEQNLIAMDMEEAEPRFLLLESMRQFATDRLAQRDEWSVTQKAHAAYFMVLAEESRAEKGEAIEEWYAEVARERGNYLAALSWLSQQRDTEWCVRLLTALLPYWEQGRDVDEGRRAIEKLLGQLPESPPSLAAAQLFHSAAILANSKGEELRAIQLQERGLKIHRAIGDPGGIGVALTAVAVIYINTGQFDIAKRYLKESLEIWRELDAHEHYSRTFSNLAYAVRQEGNYEEARRLYRQAAENFERLGDPIGAAWQVANEAGVAADLGSSDAAVLYGQARGVFEQREDAWGLASIELDTAWLAFKHSKLEEAREGFLRAVHLFERLLHPRAVARCFEGLALTADAEGNRERVVLCASAARELDDRRGGTGQTEASARVESLLRTAEGSIPRAEVDLLSRVGRSGDIQEILRTEALLKR
ncbi:MAG: protein kinase [Acidobacteriota bacterium]